MEVASTRGVCDSFDYTFPNEDVIKQIVITLQKDAGGRPKKSRPVTERALVRRINRRLQDQGERIEKWRFGPDRGSYRRLETATDWIVSPEVHLEGLGRELDVMKAWEFLRNE